MNAITLEITGMTCGHCVRAVTAALRAVPGVTAVDVKLEDGRARIAGDADPAQLIAAVAAEGYRAAPARAAGG